MATPPLCLLWHVIQYTLRLKVTFMVPLNRFTTKRCTEADSMWKLKVCTVCPKFKINISRYYDRRFFLRSFIPSLIQALTWKEAYLTRIPDDALCTVGECRLPFIHYQWIHWECATIKAFSCNPINPPFALRFNVKAFHKNHISMEGCTLVRQILQWTVLCLLVIVV
jgi:hypothetical protein